MGPVGTSLYGTDWNFRMKLMGTALTVHVYTGQFQKFQGLR